MKWLDKVTISNEWIKRLLWMKWLDKVSISTKLIKWLYNQF